MARLRFRCARCETELPASADLWRCPACTGLLDLVPEPIRGSAGGRLGRVALSQVSALGAGSGVSGLDEAALVGVDDGLDAVAEAELGEDAARRGS